MSPAKRRGHATAYKLRCSLSVCVFNCRMRAAFVDIHARAACRARSGAHAHAEPANRAYRLFSGKREAGVDHRFRRYRHARKRRAIVPSVVDQAGVVPPSAVPQYQRDIYGEVKDRGPGPHVLTGPIEIRGAMPGDVLEVRMLEINLALDWGYNRTRGLCRRNSPRNGRALFRLIVRRRRPRSPKVL